MSRPLLGLIFDLDGTLMDSAADLRVALNKLLAAHGRRAVTLDEVKSMVGDGLRRMMTRAFTATGEALSDAAETTAMQDLMRIYQTQRAVPEMLYPLARETISLFRKQGVKIGLCTNKLYIPTVRLMDDLRMTQMFDAIGGGDSYPVCKPHPGHVLGVIGDLGGLPAEACAMVGDSRNDILAAKSAGVASVAVAHGYGAGVAELEPDAVIPGFAELPQILQTLGFSF